MTQTSNSLTEKKGSLIRHRCITLKGDISPLRVTLEFRNEIFTRFADSLRHPQNLSHHSALTFTHTASSCTITSFLSLFGEIFTTFSIDFPDLFQYIN